MCEAAVASLYCRELWEKQTLSTQTGAVSAWPDIIVPASVVFLRALVLYFSTFFSRNGNISMATGHRATIPPGMQAARLIHQ